jgi:hypothetical protein
MHGGAEHDGAVRRQFGIPVETGSNDDDGSAVGE